MRIGTSLSLNVRSHLIPGVGGLGGKGGMCLETGGGPL